MDLTGTVEVLCSPGNGLTKSMVSVEWSDKHNMKDHPTLHKLIDQLWTEKSQKPIKLFNASKFRFHKIERNSRVRSVPNVKFLFGTTSYKDFIGTNCAPFSQQLVKDGIEYYSNPQSFLANPVGVGGILKTNNHDLVFIRRSNICAEMPGLLDLPGGHPEPCAVTSNLDSDIESKGVEVVNELFDSILKEIRDEINIPIEHLSYPLLLGISYNPETVMRPSLEFYVKCSLTTKEIKELYSKQTQAEKEESTNLLFIPISDVIDLDELKKRSFYRDFTHAAQSALFLLQIFLSA